MITVGCDAATTRRPSTIAPLARRHLRHRRAAPARGQPRRRHDRRLPRRPERHRRRRVRARLLLRPLTPRRSARRVRRADPTRPRASLPLVIHTRDAWADTFDVLAPRACPSGRSSTASPVAPTRPDACLDRGAYLSLQRHRHLQDGRRSARGGRAVPARPDAGRDRQPVPGAGPTPWARPTSRRTSPTSCRSSPTSAACPSTR